MPIDGTRALAIWLPLGTAGLRELDNESVSVADQGLRIIDRTSPGDAGHPAEAATQQWHFLMINAKGEMENSKWVGDREGRKRERDEERIEEEEEVGRKR